MVDALARLHHTARQWPWWGQAIYFLGFPYVALAAYGATKPEGERRNWFVGAVAVLALVAIVGGAGGAGEDDESSDVAAEANTTAHPDTETPQAEGEPASTTADTTTTTAPTTTTTLAEPDRPGDSPNSGDLYPDRADAQSEDQERHVGEEPVRLAGYSTWVLEARHVDQASEYSTNDYIRLRVRVLNRDDHTQPFSPEDWRLQAPNGQVLDPARLVIGGDELESGELVEGGVVEGHVFFLDRGLRGRYYAIYKPDAHNAARGIWGFDV